MIEIKEVYQDESLEKLKFKYHPRVVKVQAGATLATPTRAVLDVEYKRKANFSNALKLDDLVSIVVAEFDKEKLNSFVNKNGALRNLKEKIDNFSKQATDSNIKVLALKMPEDTAAFSSEKDIETFFRFLNVAQEKLNTRALPYFKSDKIDIKKMYTDFCKNFSDPIIWLDLKEDPIPFKKRLDILIGLIRDKQLQLIGVHYKDYLDANKNYDNLYSELHNENVLLILEGVPRKYVTHLSAVHFYPYVCFDAISPYRRTRITGGPTGEPKYANSILNSQFLYREQLTIDPLKSSECDITSQIFKTYKGMPMKDALQTAEELQIDYKKLREKNKKAILEDSKYNKEKLKQTAKIVRDFSYLQQVLEGQIEMSALSKSINSATGAESYLELKEKLKRRVTRFASGKFAGI